ncbi:MAG: hypothetical protein H6808_05915 [Phycisphaera sp.]|nr:hypothetical protein [Phycisphaera sp.]
MLSYRFQAFSSAIMLLAAQLAHASRCIQPDVTLVHQAERLVDVSGLGTGSVVELSNHPDPIKLWEGQGRVRLALSPEEQFRIRTPGGSFSKWFDPLEIDAAPEAVQTPGWALGAVWYNVFPERFDNAEPFNDQGWPHGTKVPWDAPWDAVSADEFEASANRSIAAPRRYRDSTTRTRPLLFETIFERRCGGDLQGVQRRLNHIKGLGATAIWLCPIFDADSLHKYDASDHRHIDPNLAYPGTPIGDKPSFTPDPKSWEWTPADRYFIDQLLPEAKRLGLKVILDGVWNHVGVGHPAFRDAVERSNASPYFDWFDLRTDSFGHVTGWRAWDRPNGNLPAFRQFDGDLAPGPKMYVENVTRRWMDPNGDGDPSDGIDGWRLDVANEIGMPFWRHWRNLVRDINPEAPLVGELWFDGSDYFGGKAFDAQMNYPLAFVLVPWLAGEPNPDIADEIAAVFAHHPATVLAQMNVLASHDTARLVSVLANPGLGYDQGAGLGAAHFDRTRPSQEAYERLELAHAVLTALPGSPMVFAGDELGLWGGDDPDNRKPLPWPDKVRNDSIRQLARDSTSSIGSWLRLRHDERAGEILRHGGWELYSDNILLIIDRDLNGNVIRLFANATNQPVPSEIGEIPARSAKMVKLETPGEWACLHQSSEKPISP